MNGKHDKLYEKSTWKNAYIESRTFLFRVKIVPVRNNFIKQLS